MSLKLESNKCLIKPIWYNQMNLKLIYEPRHDSTVITDYNPHRLSTLLFNTWTMKYTYFIVSESFIVAYRDFNGWFVFDLVGTPTDKLSLVEGHIMIDIH